MTAGPRAPPLSGGGSSGAGLGHALGLWLGTRAVVYPARARGGRTVELVETEPSPLGGQDGAHALLPGVGGPALYSAMRKERVRAGDREGAALGEVAAAQAQAQAQAQGQAQGQGQEQGDARALPTVHVGAAEGVRGRGRLLVAGGDPFFAAQAAAVGENALPLTSLASLSADSEWAMDAAYMAMAQARVAPFVRRLGAMYQASAHAAGARAGLDCGEGEEEEEEGGGSSAADKGTQSKVCYPSGLKATLKGRAEAARLLSQELAGDGSGGGGGGGSGAAPSATGTAQPCLSPLITLSDSHSLLTVHGHAEWSVEGWASHASPRAYAVRAEVVAASPLPGNLTIASPRARALRSAWGVNAGEWAGRIVLFERGAPTALAEKVRGAGDAGALGVVIMDDAEQRCGGAGAPVFTQRCVQGSDKVGGYAGGGFAASDAPEAWEAARLPTLLITRADGLRLLKLLHQ